MKYPKPRIRSCISERQVRSSSVPGKAGEWKFAGFGLFAPSGALRGCRADGGAWTCGPYPGCRPHRARCQFQPAGLGAKPSSWTDEPVPADISRRRTDAGRRSDPSRCPPCDRAGVFRHHADDQLDASRRSQLARILSHRHRRGGHRSACPWHYRQPGGGERQGPAGDAGRDRDQPGAAGLDLSRG